MKSPKQKILEVLAEVLALSSSYSKQKIMELVLYSEDTNLQLIALVPTAHKDILSAEIAKKFGFLNQQELEAALFSDLKTVEKIIDYIYEKQN